MDKKNVMVAKQVLNDIDQVSKDLFSDAERERLAKKLLDSVKPYPVRIKIQGCDWIESPREWDNPNTFVSYDRRIEGDKGGLSLLRESIEASPYYKKEWDDVDVTDPHMLPEVLERCQDIIWQYVYLYDHSGYALNTSGFSCAWDTSRIGIIFCTKAQARVWWGFKRITKKAIERVMREQDAEIEVLHQYVSGDVWSFTIYDNKGEVYDSCGGFFGYDVEENGMVDHFPENWEFLPLERV